MTYNYFKTCSLDFQDLAETPGNLFLEFSKQGQSLVVFKKKGSPQIRKK